MKKILIVVLGFAFLFSMAREGFSLMMPMRIQDLVINSSVIIIGEVIDVTIAENTYVKIMVKEYLKDKPNDIRNVIVIRTTLHGIEPDASMWVDEDEPEFELGEQVLLFLIEDDGKSVFGTYTPKDYRVLGKFQGKFQIKDNKVNYIDAVAGKSASISSEKFMLEIKKLIEDPFGYVPGFLW